MFPWQHVEQGMDAKHWEACMGACHAEPEQLSCSRWQHVGNSTCFKVPMAMSYAN